MCKLCNSLNWEHLTILNFRKWCECTKSSEQILGGARDRRGSTRVVTEPASHMWVPRFKSQSPAGETEVGIWALHLVRPTLAIRNVNQWIEDLFLLFSLST